MALRMFDFDLSDELKFKISKLKNHKQAEIFYKKIKQVISCDKDSINHYKNLRYGLKDSKRVHIDKSFVLTFKVDLNKNFILFTDFDHHDRIYKK